MISLTRLNGERIVLNADLIERAEATPDTVLTLTNGTKYVVAESLDEVMEAIQTSRATVLALAAHLQAPTESDSPPRLRVVPTPSSDAPTSGEPPPGPRAPAGRDLPSLLPPRTAPVVRADTGPATPGPPGAFSTLMAPTQRGVLHLPWGSVR